MDVRNADARERAAAPEGPPPVTSAVGFWRVAAQVATVGIFLLLFGAFLDLARLLLLPVTAAFVIGTMLGPIAERGAAHRIPQWVTAIFLVVLLVVAMNALVLILAAPVSDWVSKGPEIAVRLKEKLSLIDYPLQWLRGLRDTLNPGGDHSAPLDLGVSNLIQPALSLLTPAISFVTPAISQLLIFVGTLFFFLSSRTQMRRATAILFAGRESRLRTLRILSEVESNLTAYFATVAAIYFVEGLCVGLASYFVGLSNAAAWGTLAFVLCFIPYIGPGIVVLVLFGAGLIQFTDRDPSAARAGDLRCAGDDREQFYHADNHRPQADPEPARGVPVVGLLGMDVGAGRRIPGDAAVDRRARCRASLVSG